QPVLLDVVPELLRQLGAGERRGADHLRQRLIGRDGLHERGVARAALALLRRLRSSRLRLLGHSESDSPARGRSQERRGACSRAKAGPACVGQDSRLRSRSFDAALCIPFSVRMSVVDLTASKAASMHRLAITTRAPFESRPQSVSSVSSSTRKWTSVADPPRVAWTRAHLPLRK